MAKPGAPVPVAPKSSRTAKSAIEVVAAPTVEKKKFAPETFAAELPAAVVQEPAALVEAVKSVETKVEAIAAPVAEVVTEAAEMAAEAVPATVETIEAQTAAPLNPEPAAPTFSKELFMTDPNTLFVDFNDRAKAAMEKSARAVEELNAFAKGNVEALVESGKITAKGLELIGQDAAEYSRRSFESATAALKSMSAVKSPTDFFKLQSDFVRGAFDSYVAEASKTTEAMMKLAGEAAQPISNRVALAAEKVKVAA